MEITKRQMQLLVAVAILIVLYWGGSIFNQRAIAYTNNQSQIKLIQQLEAKNKNLEVKVQELQKKLDIIKEEQDKMEVR